MIHYQYVEQNGAQDYIEMSQKTEFLMPPHSYYFSFYHFIFSPRHPLCVFSFFHHV